MAKKSTPLKEKTVEDLGRLSRIGLKEVEDFISYVRVKEELEATKEVFGDKELVRSIARGEDDFKAARFKDWKVVREDV